MRDWMNLVATPPFPAEHAAVTALARQALDTLETIEAALAGPHERSRLLEVVRRLSAGRPPLIEADLREPRALFTWAWPLWADGDVTPLDKVLGESPPRSFHRDVTDGRDDLGALFFPDPDGQDEVDTDAGKRAPVRPDHPLASEHVDRWVRVTFASDGHQALYWDPDAADVRLLWTDNRQRDVVAHEWNGEDFLWRVVLPDLVSAHREEVTDALQSPVARSAKTAGVLLSIAALFAATIALFWLAVMGVRSCAG